MYEEEMFLPHIILRQSTQGFPENCPDIIYRTLSAQK